MNIAFNHLLRPINIRQAYTIRCMKSLEKINPGIRKRAAILQQNIGDELDEEDLENLEADFFNLGKSHKQYEREVEASNELKKYHIVKQKYFKEKVPNFLTWADKQQIKHLHSMEPDEWTIERLSEGFPALPDTIKKIIKNNWIPKNASRVMRHDEAVQQNWQQFKTSKSSLQLPHEVVEHLLKFTSRELNLNPNLTNSVEDVTKRELVKKGGEFSSIIQSYEALKAKKPKSEEQANLHAQNSNIRAITISNSSQMQSEDGMLQLNKKATTKILTYNELQQEIKHQKSKVQPKTDATTLETNSDQSWKLPNKEIVLQPNELNLSITKFKSESQVNVYKPIRDYPNLKYPERITIPTEKRKKGYTYKLNDCFYDSNGEFLYRVPGL